jgi:hypothetical protein
MWNTLVECKKFIHDEGLKKQFSYVFVLAVEIPCKLPRGKIGVPQMSRTLSIIVHDGRDFFHGGVPLSILFGWHVRSGDMAYDPTGRAIRWPGFDLGSQSAADRNSGAVDPGIGHTQNAEATQACGKFGGR